MIVSIHQPAYLPWLGYFDKIQKSDLFLYLDTVQFQKGSFQNRNKLRTKGGWVWQTVPVQTKGILYEHSISEIEIDNRQPWQAKHWATIKQNYSKAPFSSEWLTLLEPFYHTSYDCFSDLCWDMLLMFNKALGISTPMQKTSEMTPVDGTKSDLVLNLCRQSNARTYLSGSQGRGYLDEDTFAKFDIAVVYQDFSHPIYTQCHGGFEPNMGIIDLLMNAPDPSGSLKV
jgi:hypothetical protein